MYNLKVRDYGNGQVQTRIYSHLIYTGKKEKANKPETEVNPFDGEKAVVVDSFESAETAHERSVMNSLKRAKNKIYDLSRANVWDWFVTLTFAPDKVNRYDYSDCTKKLSKWLNNMKTDCPGFKYLVVPELHKDGAYHFHGLFAGCDSLGIVPSGHCDASGNEIYNIGRYKMGFTTATRIRINDAATKYITKYTTKDLMDNTTGRKKYWSSRNLNLPVDYTAVLEYDERLLLHDELVQDDIKQFKSLNYQVGFENRNVCYYENIVENEGIGYDMRIFERSVDNDSITSV